MLSILTAVLLAQAPATDAAPAGDAAAPAKPKSELEGMPFNKFTVGEISEKHLPEIQACYEQGMAAKGQTGKNAPGGRVEATWTITTDGLSTEVKVKKSQVKDREVLDCIELAIRNWEFPKPSARTPMAVPFQLRPSTGVDKPSGEGKEPAAKPKGAQK